MLIKVCAVARPSELTNRATPSTTDRHFLMVKEVRQTHLSSVGDERGDLTLDRHVIGVFQAEGKYTGSLKMLLAMTFASMKYRRQSSSDREAGR